MMLKSSPVTKSGLGKILNGIAYVLYTNLKFIWKYIKFIKITIKNINMKKYMWN